ncbi:MAG: hypothetical protein GY805_22040 [Chloroflexi bacterium]|nr:hypothetical protein [Chloroflexota bacterium]
MRIFVNEGEPMAVLLRRMEKRPFLTKLLAAFPDKTSPPQSLQSPIPSYRATK